MNLFEFDTKEEILRKQMFDAYYNIMLDQFKFVKNFKFIHNRLPDKEKLDEIEGFYTRLKWFNIPCEEIDNMMNELIVRMVSES
jgi:hypothetical protein